MAKKKGIKPTTIIPAPKQGKNGRPSRSEDPELVNKVLQTVRLGLHIEVAAAMCKVSAYSLTNWIRKGRERPESIFGAFVVDLEKAVADAEFRDMSIVDQFAHGRDAQYVMEPVTEPVFNSNGEIIYDRDGYPITKPSLDQNGNPLMRVSKDSDGKPILRRQEVKPTWQAAAWKLEKRAPTRWGRYIDDNPNKILDINIEKKSNQVVTADMEKKAIEEARRLARHLDELEDDPYGI